MADTTRPRLRPLLVPSEHGAWSFVLEPIVLGVLVAPSTAAVPLALAALSLFFARQPAKLALQDLSRGQRYPRTLRAARLAIGLVTAGGLFALAAWRVSPHPWWVPVAIAAPLGLLQLAYDVRREGRGLVPESAGPVAAAVSAPAIAAAAGWSPAGWATLWALIALKGIAATLYVRARLRVAKGEPADRVLPLVAHVAAIGAAAALAQRGHAPWLAAVAFTLLSGRAAAGLSSARRPTPARTIGFTEVAWGAVFVVLVAAGYFSLPIAPV